jgi:hypothetical protein
MTRPQLAARRAAAKKGARSRKTEEEKVLDYLRETGGHFSVFWATENQRRACALDRLIRSGAIREDHQERGMGYPRCHAVIVSRGEDGEAASSSGAAGNQAPPSGCRRA